MDINKSRRFSGSISFMIAIFAVFSFALISAGDARAASTIGTNITTTGTFKAQATASASYFLTGNTIQVGGFASAAYSRFGTATTTHAGSITTTNDLLISGDLEVNGSAAFDGFAVFGAAASISGVLELADGQIRPSTDGTTAFRFQNAAGTTSTLVIDTTNGWVGIGTTPQTKFEVQGTASASYFLTGNTIQVGGFSSAAYSRFGTATTTHAGSISTTNDLLISGDLEVDASAAFDGFARFTAAASVSASGRVGLEVRGIASASFIVGGGVASVSSVYAGEFSGTATTSVLFGTTATNKGTCFQLRDSTGAWVFARIINGNAWSVTSISCR